MLRLAHNIGKLTIFVLILSTASGVWGSEPATPPRLVLTGRLEELAGKGARLPIGMTMKGLRAQQPKVDTSARNARVSSYPNTWSGQWGGHLIVTKLWERTADPYASIHVGSSGVTVFSFLTQGPRTRLQPTDIFFEPHLLPAAQAEYTSEQVKLMQSRSRKLDPNKLLMAVDVLRLRQAIAYNPFKKEQFDFSVLLNSLRRLTPVVSPRTAADSDISVMEQDIVVTARTQTTHERTFTETVIRLSRVKDRPDLLWAQVAHLGYDKFGVSDKKIIMEGWLSTNWRSCATEIEKLQGLSVAQLGYQELCGGMSEQPASTALQATVTENAHKQPPRAAIIQNTAFQGVSSYAGQGIKVLQTVAPQPVKPGKEIKPLVASPMKAAPATSKSTNAKLIHGDAAGTTSHVPANVHP